MSPKGKGYARRQYVPKQLREAHFRPVPAEEFAGYWDRIPKEFNKGFIDEYTAAELRAHNAECFKLEMGGVLYDAGYAIFPNADGSRELVAVHNNSSLHNVGRIIAQDAQAHNANLLYAFTTPVLMDMYRSVGFKETDRYKFDPEQVSDVWKRNPAYMARAIKEGWDVVEMKRG